MGGVGAFPQESTPTSPVDLDAKGDNPLLSEDAFSNERSQKLFEAIDELQSCGAGRDIGLPELVIVGDQSAGKSSLLQSLTDIPFPVADRLCTRFPTRIVSRRTQGGSESTKLSIEPALSRRFYDDRSDDRKEKYISFARNQSSFSADDFTKAIEDASSLMGISSTTAENRQNFSSDILKIEISGPSRSHFSILDVPGVFQSLTKGMNPGEPEAVKQMVMSHMWPPQSIIVCVASGTNDLANQAVFDMASTVDVQGERTVGVITKCDVTQHVDQVMNLARNQEKHFHHGWFVVRNRTPAEVGEDIRPIERHLREERFFQGLPWNALPGARRGTQALKTYLAGLLCQRIENGFPAMLKTIQKLIESTDDELKSLGEPRAALEQKRAYLTRIAQRFHSSSTSALQGRYDASHNIDTKLRKQIRDANDGFTRTMREKGHVVAFLKIPENTSTSYPNGQGFPKNSQPQTLETDRTGCDPSISFGQINSNPSSGSGLFSNLNNASTLEAPKTGGGLFSSSPSAPPVGSSGGVRSGGGLFGSAPSAPSVGSSGGGLFSSSTSPPTSGISGGAKSGGGLFSPQAGSSFFGGFGSGGSVSGVKTQDERYSKGSVNTSLPNRSSNPSANQTTGIFGGPAVSAETQAGTPNGGPSAQFATPQAHSGRTITPKTPDVGPASQPPISKILSWIRDEIKANRGTELQGTLNPHVLPTLFHKQSEKWGSLSETHFLDIVDRSTRAMKQILQGTACDSGTEKRIMRRIEEMSKLKKASMLELLESRVRDIRSRHLQTNNPAFEENVAQARLLRFRAALERYRQNQPASAEADKDGMQLTIDLRDTTALFRELHSSNSQNLENEIHDTLKAYYDIARDDFVEFVAQLVVEAYVSSHDGPVLFFSPVYVAGLSDEDVEYLAQEDMKLIRERTEKEETLARLQHAEKIALKYA